MRAPVGKATGLIAVCVASAISSVYHLVIGSILAGVWARSGGDE